METRSAGTTQAEDRGLPSVAAGPGTPRRRRIRAREARLAYALMAPAVLVLVVLVLFPVVWNLLLSIQQIGLAELRTQNFFDIEATLENYREVVGRRNFWDLLRTTAIISVFGTALSVIMGLWVSLVLRHTFRGRFLVRGAMLFPYVIPVVAATFVWRVMLNPQFGIVNELAGRVLGGQRIPFLTQRSMEVGIFGASLTVPVALSMVILFQAWRYFPFAFLFILARLQAIPKELEESAAVDGATLTQRFWYVILPQLRSVLAVVVLLRFIWTFNTFDDIYLLTGGAGGTEVITIQIYQSLTGRGDVGNASALSIVLAVALTLMLIVYFRRFYTEERR